MGSAGEAVASFFRQHADLRLSPEQVAEVNQAFIAAAQQLAAAVDAEAKLTVGVQAIREARASLLKDYGDHELLHHTVSETLLECEEFCLEVLEIIVQMFGDQSKP